MPCARVGHIAARSRILPGNHLARQDLAGVVAVDEQGAECGERPEHHDEVQQAGARVDEVLAVEGQQNGGNRAEERRSEHPAGRATDHQDRDGAEQGDPEPPSERAGPPEDVLAGRDDPLADRGVDHELGVGAEDVRGAVGEQDVRALDARGMASLVAVQEVGVALLDVVRLVEDELVGFAELPEPQEAADCRDDQRRQPAPHHVGGPVSEQLRAQLLGRGHGRYRMQPGAGTAHALPNVKRLRGSTA